VGVAESEGVGVSVYSWMGKTREKVE